MKSNNKLLFLLLSFCLLFSVFYFEKNSKSRKDLKIVDSTKKVDSTKIKELRKQQKESFNKLSKMF